MLKKNNKKAKNRTKQNQKKKHNRIWKGRRFENTLKLNRD